MGVNALNETCYTGEWLMVIHYIITGIQNCNKSKLGEFAFFPFIVPVYSNTTFRRVAEVNSEEVEENQKM